MNELIKELVRQYCPNGEPNLSRNQFAEAIQTACKAQRNACIREFKRYSKAHEYKISNNWAKAISMSKIERQDCE